MPKIGEQPVDKNIIELTDTNNQDLQAFLFCAHILVKENKDNRKHVTRLSVSGNHVYGTNGIAVRRARLENVYKDGMYRVFRKEPKNVILYLDDGEYPDAEKVFDHENQSSLCQVSVDSDYYPAHAQITHATNLVFRAEALKNATGVYEVYGVEDKKIILDNEEYSIAIAPMQQQSKLPGI